MIDFGLVLSDAQQAAKECGSWPAPHHSALRALKRRRLIEEHAGSPPWVMTDEAKQWVNSGSIS